MSPRSFRRANQRRAAAERRRSLRSRRAGLAAGAVGAFALASPAAAAADFEVQTLNDGPVAACTGSSCATLRDAVAAANAAAGADTITFASTLTGELRLTEGTDIAVQSADNAATTIDGPGAGLISISGDADNNGQDAGDVRIFNMQSVGPLTISGLTLTEGFGEGGNSGGAILSGNSSSNTGALTVIDSTISGNTATGAGGAISQAKYAGELTVTGSTISGNTATGGNGGGIVAAKYAGTTVTNSTISGNTASGSGGGIDGGKYSGTTVTNSTISGNTASAAGGGIVAGGKYSPLQLTGSTISGNTAAGTSGGGGIYFSDPTCSPSPGGDCTNVAPVASEIRNTTISGNHATAAGGHGAGITISGLIEGDQFSVSHSTIFGNDGGGGSRGGGLSFISNSPISGAFELTDSTISGNVAETGAGINLGVPGTQLLTATGSLALDNSTIATNSATVSGGGIYLASYGGGPTSATIPLGSTIVGNNTAGGSSNDLDRADGSTGGGFDLAFSLIEAPGDAPFNQTSSILGVDPRLNVIANNGGPTQTLLPQTTSAAIDKGRANGLTTDQRGFPRTVDGTGIPNAADGTDIGSVELSNPPAAAVAKKKCKAKKKKGKKGSAQDAKKKKKKCKKKKKKGKR